MVQNLFVQHDHELRFSAQRVFVHVPVQSSSKQRLFASLDCVTIVVQRCLAQP